MPDTENQIPSSQEAPEQTTTEVVPQKYGVFDEQGFPIGFYSNEIHTPDQIPSGAIEITEDQWLEFINNAGTRVWIDGGIQEIEVQQPSITWDQIRDVRNGLLLASDWTQLPDVPFAENGKEEWALYRQILRDIPQDFVSPDDVEWPSKPE